MSLQEILRERDHDPLRPRRSSGGPLSMLTRLYPTAQELVRINKEAARRTSAGEQLRKLLAAVADCTTPIQQINRLILRRMVGVIEEMADGIGSRPLAWLNAEMRALQMMHQVLVEGRRQQRREDVLNIDGPKFRAAYEYFLDLFCRALKESGLGNDSAGHVMRHFRDLAVTEEGALRHAVAEAE